MSGEAPTDRLRAGNDDRELIAERLRTALDEGRITLSEFDERIAVAYRALTYADLNVLLADIPTQGGVLEIRPMKETGTKPHPVTERRAKSRPAPSPERDPHRMPTALMILWTIWLSVVAINVVVWLLVTVLTGNFIYPWPLWVAGPTGAALAGVTFGIQKIRERHRQERLERGF